MIIQINDKWRIKTSDMTWDVQNKGSVSNRARKADRGIQWNTEAYCSSLENAIKWLYDKLLRQSSATDLFSIRDDIARIKQEILDAIKEGNWEPSEDIKQEIRNKDSNSK